MITDIAEIKRLGHILREPPECSIDDSEEVRLMYNFALQERQYQHAKAWLESKYGAIVSEAHKLLKN